MTQGFRCYEVLKLPDHEGHMEIISLQQAHGKAKLDTQTSAEGHLQAKLTG